MDYSNFIVVIISAILGSFIAVFIVSVLFHLSAKVAKINNAKFSLAVKASVTCIILHLILIDFPSIFFELGNTIEWLILLTFCLIIIKVVYNTQWFRAVIALITQLIFGFIIGYSIGIVSNYFT